MPTRTTLAATAVVVAACGPTITSTPTNPPTSPPTTAPPATVASTTTTSTQATTTTAPSTTTTTIPVRLELGEWEGEPIEFGPTNGEPLVVVGVRFNDVLNVRLGPGSEFGVVTTLEPEADAIAALGLAWQRQGATWYAIQVGDEQGWASASFLAVRAGSFDFTSNVVERLGGVPESGSLIELGLTVARSLASDDPASRIEQPAEVVVGAVGEMTIDVLGLGDDSVAGYRLAVTATSDDGTWILERVEATVLCTWGATGDFCV